MIIKLLIQKISIELCTSNSMEVKEPLNFFFSMAVERSDSSRLT